MNQSTEETQQSESTTTPQRRVLAPAPVFRPKAPAPAPVPVPVFQPSGPAPQPKLPMPRPMTPAPQRMTPASEHMVPMLRTRLPTPRPGIPMPRPGIPMPRPGIPMPRPGIPMPRPGIPTPRPGIPMPRAMAPTCLPARHFPRPSQPPAGSWEPISLEDLTAAIHQYRLEARSQSLTGYNTQQYGPPQSSQQQHNVHYQPQHQQQFASNCSSGGPHVLPAHLPNRYNQEFPSRNAIGSEDYPPLGSPSLPNYLDPDW